MTILLIACCQFDTFLAMSLDSRKAQVEGMLDITVLHVMVDHGECASYRSATVLNLDGIPIKYSSIMIRYLIIK